MPVAYAGAAMAVAQGVQSMTADDSKPQSSGSMQGGTNGWSGGGGNQMLAGGLANSLNPTQSQTSPGDYSPPSNSGQGYNYIPTGQGSIDQYIQSILNGPSGTSLTAGVQDPNTVQGFNPYAPNIQDPNQWPSILSNMYGTMGYGQYGAGSQLTNEASSYFPMLQQMYQSAMDPRSALYNRTANQVQDQVRAGEAARGLATSPYAAGIENKAMSDFNIDWQNQQLQRQLQGAAGVGQGLNQIGGAQTAGATLQGTGVGNIQRGSRYAMDLYSELQRNYLATMGEAKKSDMAGLTPAIQYMGTAQRSNELAQRSAYQDAVLKGNQNANAAAGISSGLDKIMPWIGNGLSGLYDSIFKGDGTSGYGTSWDGMDANALASTAGAGGMLAGGGGGGGPM